MAGAGGNKKVKVKRFKLEWLDLSIDGNKASLWLKPDVSDSGRALCTVCPAPCSIKINEGWRAVKQHGMSKKHKEHQEKSQTDPNFRQVDNSSPSIVQSIAKLVEQKKVMEKMTDKRLRSQIIYVASAMYHGCSRLIIECQAEIFPKSQEHIKKQFRILGEKFSNVIEILELPDMMSEISQVCYLMRSTEGLEGVEKGDADGLMSALHDHKDIEGSQEFPLLTKLGSSCCTVYNSSSSPAERDFSHMNEIVGGGGSKNRTSQELLLAKMTIKAEINMLARKCVKCKDLKEDQKSDHCHLFSPSEELMETMRGGGQPHQRYQMALDKAAAEDKDVEVLKILLEEEDKSAREDDMKDEVIRLQKRCLEKKKAAKKAKEKEQGRGRGTTHVSNIQSELLRPGGSKEAGGVKRKISQAEEKRQEQRKRLKSCGL